jgi:CRISPR-associated protein Cas2
MVLVSYDISNDKLRTKFAKYLSKYGYRLQYSVFKIENSNRLLDNIIQEIENNFSKKFEQCDSIYIFKLSSSCEVVKYGYAKNDDSDVMVVC